VLEQNVEDRDVKVYVDASQQRIEAELVVQKQSAEQRGHGYGAMWTTNHESSSLVVAHQGVHLFI